MKISKIVETSSISYREQVRLLLLEYLKTKKLKSSDNLPTVREIANALSVSRGTVGLAIKELAREGIVYSRMGKGTFLLSTDKIKVPTNLLALFIPNMNNPIFAEFASEIEKDALKNGYAMSICVGDGSVKQLKGLSILQKKGADGIIGLGISDKAIKKIITTNIPFVGVNLPMKRYYQGRIDIVTCDEEKAASFLTSHLISLGHRRIAISTLKGSKDGKLMGFKKALQSSGIPFRENMVIEDAETIDSSSPQWHERIGRTILKQVLMLKEKPSALIVSNDARAIGVLHEAREKGIRIPEDMSVVGFDNISMSGMLNPPLTTVDLKFREAAQKAFQLLQAQISGKVKNGNRYIQLEPKLVVRKSSRKLKKALGDGS